MFRNAASSQQRQFGSDNSKECLMLINVLRPDSDSEVAAAGDKEVSGAFKDEALHGILMASQC